VKLDPNVKSHDFSAMRVVFENGEVLVEDTFEEIRSRAKV
jgi:acyl-coenzyme A synthetase/AMP-(fatty) acid ligase